MSESRRSGAAGSPAQRAPWDLVKLGTMKLVEAIIQPHHLTAVLTALERVNVERLTVLDGFSDCEEALVHPPKDSKFLRNLIIEVVVNDDFLDRTLSAISVAAPLASTVRTVTARCLSFPWKKQSTWAAEPAGRAQSKRIVAMRMVALAKDLTVTSKLARTRSGPHEADVQSTLPHVIASLRERPADLILVDLTCQTVDASVVDQIRVANCQPCQIAAFGPHVQEHKLTLAAEAGCDHVWARGQWEHELFQLLR